MILKEARTQIGWLKPFGELGRNGNPTHVIRAVITQSLVP